MNKVHQEQILEWLDNPVTLLYIEILNEQLTSLQNTERYRPTMSIGDRQVPASADYIAMQQAKIEGQIESIKEISNLKEMLINES